jgi:hypothetical protein
MSVASRTPSGIGIITLRSTTAIDWSSASVSIRRCFSTALSVPCCACVRATAAQMASEVARMR